MELRYYQQAAKDNVFKEWESVNKTLLVMATGTGKTIVFSKITEELVRQGNRVLILAHRGELLEQASDKLAQATGLGTALEKADSTSIGSWYRVVVGSVQTLMREERLKKFPKDFFDYIIVDETHRIMADSYMRIMDYFGAAKVLGVTATADRSDMQSLGNFFESLAYEYSLPQAIKDKFLSPIKALTIPLKIDLSNVGMTTGDFNVNQIDTALDPYLYQIAEEMVKHCSDRKTVVFLPLIATSQKFTRVLNEKGFRAVEVNGESQDRDQILKDFDNDKYNVICNSMLLTEGWDSPAVDCVIVLRPTKVRSLYTQMIGRGTRLYPGKEELLVIDFLWLTQRLDLCHPASLVSTDDEVVGKMTSLVEKETESGHPTDILELEEEAVSTVLEEREERLAEELEKNRKRKGNLVDAIQYERSILDPELMNYVPDFGYESKPVTDEQRDILEKAGVSTLNLESSGKADMLIETVNRRSEQGLATPKQIRMLERKGFKNVGEWTTKDASSIISRYAMIGWRGNPRGITPSTYKPPVVKQEEKATTYGWD